MPRSRHRMIYHCFFINEPKRLGTAKGDFEVTSKCVFSHQKSIEDDRVVGDQLILWCAGDRKNQKGFPWGFQGLPGKSSNLPWVDIEWVFQNLSSHPKIQKMKSFGSNLYILHPQKFISVLFQHIWTNTSVDFWGEKGPVSSWRQPFTMATQPRRPITFLNGHYCFLTMGKP